MTEENARLIEENYNLFYAYFHKNNIKDEDMRQELIMNLCQKVDCFDPSKGKFSTFVFKVFSTSFANCIKHTKLQKERVNHECIRLEDHNPQNDNEVANWYDIIADTVDSIGDYEYQLLMEQILEKLSASNNISKATFNNYVSWLRTGSFVESGKELGVSRQAVQKSVKLVQTYLQSMPGIDWRK